MARSDRAVQEMLGVEPAEAAMVHQARGFRAAPPGRRATAVLAEQVDFSAKAISSGANFAEMAIGAAA